MMAENRVKTPAKIFVVILAVYGLYFVYIYRTRIEETKETIYVMEEARSVLHNAPSAENDMKYVLQWTRKSMPPFDLLGSGTSAFVKNKCNYTNCFVTDNRTFINLTDFDAIVFNGKDVCPMHSYHFPARRSPKQKYIFGAMESADYYPLCAGMLDTYFNWTFTYKLDSDFRWGYITIYDLEGNIVGPAIDMKWPENMEPISEDLKVKLSSKSKAAAWFVSNCYAKSKRNKFVTDLVSELKPYGWTVDIYGSCGKLSCSKKDANTCFKLVEHEYYFYMSLENSFSEDYVTEKLLTALNNYAVPVVFGAANYSRFLPDGSYLDGRKLGPKKLASLMSEIIGNKTMYHDYFRWRNHFVYKETSAVDVCKLCENLNNEELMNNISVAENFRVWWNGENYDTNCPKNKRTYLM